MSYHVYHCITLHFKIVGVQLQHVHVQCSAYMHEALINFIMHDEFWHTQDICQVIFELCK